MSDEGQDQPKLPKVVDANKFMANLFDAGLIPENTYRVIIDCKVGNVAKIHYSLFATDQISLIVVESANEIEIAPEVEK